MFSAIVLASPLDSQRLFAKQCQPLMYHDPNDDGEVDPVLAAAEAAIESPVAPKVGKKARKAPQEEEEKEEEGKEEEVVKQYEKWLDNCETLVQGRHTSLQEVGEPKAC